MTALDMTLHHEDNSVDDLTCSIHADCTVQQVDSSQRSDSGTCPLEDKQPYSPPRLASGCVGQGKGTGPRSVAPPTLHSGSAHCSGGNQLQVRSSQNSGRVRVSSRDQLTLTVSLIVSHTLGDDQRRSVAIDILQIANS